MEKKQGTDNSDTKNTINVEKPQDVTNSGTEGTNPERPPLKEEEKQTTDTQENISGAEGKKDTADPNDASGSRKVTDTKQEEFKIFKWIKTGLIWVVKNAALVTALVSLFTLVEMRTERINAYKPEIVVLPHIFEGGDADSDEIFTDQSYLYFRYEVPNPDMWYLDRSSDERYYDPDWLMEEVNKGTNIQYIEEPYLTLKNIGEGIAKEIKIEFSSDWMESMVYELNQEESDEYEYIMEKTYKDVYDIDFYTLDKPRILSESTLVVFFKEEVDISYISPNEDLVKVGLPDSWNRVFIAYYAQQIRSFPEAFQTSTEPGVVSSISRSKRLPDLTLNISYEDAQGIKHKETVKVPWTINIMLEPNEQKEDKVYTIHLHTGFYDGYLR